MKLTPHAWLLWAIALVVVLVLAFVIPFVHTVAFWIALVCTVAMFGVCAFGFYRAFRKDNTVESKLLGWPIFRVSYVALMVQTAVGFALMALAAFCPEWAAALAEVAVFAVTAVCMTVKDAVREAVSVSENTVRDDTAGWKAIRARASMVASSTGHPELKKLAEAIRFADPMPTSLDGEVEAMLNKLSSYADAENIRKAFVLLDQRNALSREAKKQA